MKKLIALLCISASVIADPVVLLEGGEAVPSEVIVKFKSDAPPGSVATLLSEISGSKKDSIAANTSLITYPASADFKPIKDKILNSPLVESAEPNFVYKTQAIPNDTYYSNGSLWGMQGGYGSRANEAWANNHTDCSSVYVGMVDEGYMYQHQDLGSNVGTVVAEIPGNRLDDDGNGYKDDYYGWDFDGNNNSLFDGVPIGTASGDYDTHGTHVAGTIGGVGNNSEGITGVCWKVKIISAKFLKSKDGTGNGANAVKAINYFVDLKARSGINLVAINNSWSGGGYSATLSSAIDAANTAGILIVAAAGNGGVDGIGDDNDATPSYPASYSQANVISVAAVDSAGNLASFSNYGATSVDIGAPGVAIYSSVPTRTGRETLSSYISWNGTSMAAPHVTGAAALYKAYHPTATAAQIKAAILNSATPTASLAGKTVTGGRLNISTF